MLTRRDALHLSAALAGGCLFGRTGRAADPRPKTLNDTFEFTPPKSAAEWAARRERLREQVKVACGLWPAPDKGPLNATVRRLFDRPDYSVDAVHFDSLPGHRVTGNLYRPVGDATGKRPAVLFAHGHWADGRLHDAGEAGAKGMVARGEEADARQARYFMQALPITFARLGFVVFQYDMVGYAESTAVPHIKSSGVPHPQGFADAEGELRLQSLMGLQTWNSVRALDFVESLADVDPKRIGVTGASGGGTQTFLLAAVDDRIACAAPAVMVSVGMQGGCVCENCSLLRVNTGNVELAGVFAPKPLAMTGANDWTKEIMTRGLPELRKLYKLLGAEENVAAKAWVQYPHNYNKHARKFVYGWFNKHLQGKPGPVAEPAFEPVEPDKLRVYDKTHPRPAAESDAKQLRDTLTKLSDKQLEKLGDRAGPVTRAALRAMANSELPAAGGVRVDGYKQEMLGTTARLTATLARHGAADGVPSAGLVPAGSAGAAVLWLHPDGAKSLTAGGAPSAAAGAFSARGMSVLAIDFAGANGRPKPPAPNPVYAGFTWGYNRAPLAERTHDALTALGNLLDNAKAKSVAVVGWGDAGLAAVLAAALAGDKVTKVAADLNKFRFEDVKDLADPRLLPGALKYGGLPAFLDLIACPVLVWNAPTGVKAGGKREVRATPPTAAEVAAWVAG